MEQRPKSPDVQSRPAPAGVDPRSAEELVHGNAAFVRGDLKAAYEHYSAALRLKPQSAELHCRIAYVFWHGGDAERAQTVFQQAADLDPQMSEAHEALGQLFMEQGRIELALQHARRAIELSPEDKEAAVTLGMVLQADRQAEAARKIVQSLLSSGHQSPRLAGLFARTATTENWQEALKMALSLLESGRAQLAREQASLHFVAADLLDKLGRYDEAFAHAQRGNELRGGSYQAARLETYVSDVINYFSRQRAASLPRATHGNEKPVFLVGMPRSGSTLIEQVLASHPGLFGAGELNWMFRVGHEAARAANGTQFPHCLDRLSVSDINALADSYLQPLSALAPAATRITDKMLSNFLHLGLIALLFPQARVIHCRRDPIDTCLSCFMTDFTSTQEFTRRLDWCGHFYRQYERLMDHWKAALNLPILDVYYEELVGDLEAQARRAVAFLGLPWDPRCLDFHENRRFVATSSNEQVRKPIYKTSIQRWRHYESHLQPLRAALAGRQPE